MKNQAKRLLILTLAFVLMLGAFVPSVGGMPDYIFIDDDSNGYDEESRGWGFIDVIDGVELYDQDALDEMGDLGELLLELEPEIIIYDDEIDEILEDEITEHIIVYESPIFFNSPPTALEEPLDMSVYDVLDFADREDKFKINDNVAIMDSAYEIAEYMMYSIMSGDGWAVVQQGQNMSAGYYITFRANTGLSVNYLKSMLSEVTRFIYAYFPHHHHFVYTYGIRNNIVGDVTLMVAQSSGSDHRYWEAEYEEADKLVTNFSDEDFNDISDENYNDTDESKRMLWVHNYLASNVVYDLKAPNNGQYAYNALVLKRGVCNAYALAYSMISFRMGFNIPYISGDVLGADGGPHAWNINLESGYDGTTGSILSIDPTWGRRQFANDPERYNLSRVHFNKPLTDYIPPVNPAGTEARVWSPYYESYIAYVNGIEDFELEPNMMFYVEVDGAAFAEEAVTMQIGGTRTLIINYMPSNATPDSVVWSIDNHDEENPAASIDSRSGLITALAEGTATVRVIINENFELECGLIVTDILDYSRDNDIIVPGSIDGAAAEGFAINLSQERLIIAEGSSISEYRVNGGAKWKAGTLTDAQLAKLLNKVLTLHLKVKIDGEDQIVIFEEINKRAPAPKLVVNYKIGEDKTGATPGEWLLSVRNGTEAVRDKDKIEIAAAAASGKTPDDNGWGVFAEGRGVAIKRLTGTKVTRERYFIRTPPNGDNGVYTAASKPRKINVTSEQKKPNYKVKAKDAKKNKAATAVINIKAGTYVSINGGEPVYYPAKAALDVLNVTGTLKLWQEATAKKAASAALEISR